MKQKTDSAPLHKNDDIVLSIDDLGSDGEGIGHYNGFAVFVVGALPQEKILAHVIKVTSHYAIAIIKELIISSLNRVKPQCSSFPQCGGCHLQHLSYEAELIYKKNKIESCLKRIGGVEDIEIPEVLSCPNWSHYRNKAQFPIQDDNHVVKYGFFASRSHRIVALPEDGCLLQNSIANELIKDIVTNMNLLHESAYNEETHKGLIRHVLIRTLESTSVTFVISRSEFKNINLWKDFFHKKQVLFSVNYQPNDDNVILGPKMLFQSGEPSIGSIGTLRYYVSPQSFFQVNSYLTKTLYQTALDFAELSPEDDVLDLYCGAGTISLFLAQKAHQVIGVEIVPEAIENAKRNAELNQITNCKFFSGPCESITEGILQSEAFNPSVIILDPPRSGCDYSLIQFISGLNIEKIVYVSCDPATLARDIKNLSLIGHYQVKKVQGVDMFPRTVHVETVVLLTK